MIAVEWNDNLATNIEMIDTQHKEIIRRINDVLEAGTMTNRPELLARALLLLREYCATHFSQEENLQLRSEYPSYKSHKQLHIAFLNEIRGYQDVLEKSQPTEQMAINIEKTVSEWLIKHINGIDKVLAKYLFEKNFLK